MVHSAELLRPSELVNSHWETGSENSDKTIHRATPLNSEESTSQNSIPALPLGDLSSRRDRNHLWFEDRPAPITRD
jgi:hypothetical protein